MAVFVELDDDDDDAMVQLPHEATHEWPSLEETSKEVLAGPAVVPNSLGDNEEEGGADGMINVAVPESDSNGAGQNGLQALRDIPKRSRMTEALGCYPITKAVAAGLDLNTLDNLSRTSRHIHDCLLQYRKSLLASTLHCCNEDLPLDPEQTLRFRARASNWFYMEDTARTIYNGKSGQCARDLVSQCRRCGTAVCRNCAIKPPAPIVLRDRHRRLCKACTKAPITSLVKPRPLPTTPLDSDLMQRLICTCQTEGVWLCHPCGRSIRGDDYEYGSIWKWRNQYGEVLGGVGTGIGDGDRGVICGRNSKCCATRDQEQETDCDAEDAREAEEGILLGDEPSTSVSPPPTVPHPWSHPSGANSFSSLSSLQASLNGYGHTAIGAPGALAAEAARRTPSPALGPGYVRHEIEGIGGVVKTKRLRMVKLGACVHEYEDEKSSGEILSREIKGKTRSWCGWCWRVIPGKKDEDAAKQPAGLATGRSERSDSDSSSS